MNINSADNSIVLKNERCNCHANLWSKMGLSLKQVSRIMHKRNEIFYNKGETILKQGTDITHVHIVKNGIVAQFFEEGEKKIAFNLVKDINFAFLPFLNLENIQPCTVKAIVPTSICTIKSNEFYEVIKENFHANNYLIQWYYNYICEIYKIIRQYVFFNNIGKMAIVIKKLSEEKWNNISLLSILDKSIILQMVGISEESASKILADLKKDKIIYFDNKKREIVNPAALDKLCKFG